MPAKPRQRKPCTKCGRTITNSNYEKHFRACNGEIPKERFVKEEWLQLNGNYKCPYCGKECKKKGIAGHIWRYHTEAGKGFDPNRGYREGTRKAWGKGATTETNPIIKRRARSLKESYSSGRLVNHFKGGTHTEERKRLMSLHAKKNGLGGHVSKHSMYYKMKDGKVVYLHSNFEVRVAQSLDENNVEWSRPKPLTWTDAKGVDHRYYPDFYLVKYKVYLDPKNDYLIREHTEKISKVQEQNDVVVLVLNSKQLEWQRIREVMPA